MTDTANLSIAASNLKAWAHGLVAIQELTSREIPVLVLKSLPQVEDLYGGPGGRPTGDVDLVVPASRAAQAIEVLIALGWQVDEQEVYDFLAQLFGWVQAAMERPWHLRNPARGDSLLDLHPTNMIQDISPVLDEAIWHRAQHVERDGIRFLVLSPEDRLLYLCYHFFKESSFRGLDEVRLKDIVAILRRGGDMNWTDLRARSAVTGTNTFLHLACDLAADRSEADFVRHWRLHVPVSAPVRHFLLSQAVRHAGDRLSRKQLRVLWVLAHDNVPVALLVRLYARRMERVQATRRGVDEHSGGHAR